MQPHATKPSQWPVEGTTSVEATAYGEKATADTEGRLIQELVFSTDSDANTNVLQEPSIRPSNALPVTSDDASSLNRSIPQKLVTEQARDNVRTVHLPSKEAQEERLKHLEHLRIADERAPDVTKTYENVNGLTPPTSVEDASPPSRSEQAKPGNDGLNADTILRSQMDIGRTDVFVGTPSTPDEQLRLEQAQSLQLSKGPDGTHDVQDVTQKAPQSMLPPSGLPSQLSRDSMTEGGLIETDVREERSVRGGTNEQNEYLARPALGMRDHMFPGINGESARDLTLSRRPPMRIDTGVPSTSASAATADSRPAAATPMSGRLPPASATPSKLATQPGSAQSPPERMTTRVSSGALRHKSVSEILGETPKPTPTQAEKGAFDRGFGESHREDQGTLQTPKSASSFASPDPAVFKQRLNELKEKERSKLSTVVFSGSRGQDPSQGQRSDDNEVPVEDKDYLLTLFTAKVSTPPRAHSLNALVKSAHKTLTTSDFYTDLNERQACQVLSRIYDLQSSNRWSLRQMERSAEPTRPTTHWDVLLSQMRWMRTDYREERKWKMAAAKYTADACASWVAGNPEERKFLQVKVRAKATQARSRSLSASTPDLVHSPDDEVSEVTDDDSVRDKGPQGSAPAALFSLPSEMFVFGLNKSPVAEKLLLELPLYQPNTEVQDSVLQVTDFSADAVWKKPLVPVSKFAEGKILTQEEGPPRKRSRFDYEDADRSSSRTTSDLAHENFELVVMPEQEDVALFDPENKHIRDRIHTGHAFRPPSEHVMPSQNFFESRQSSQWTPEEDHELRKLVRDFAYNWSLISSCLSSPSMFASGAERRTPWECFERWISLEGLPVEMAKINYFRAYHARLQAAQKTVEAQQQALQQSQGNSGQLPMRRRTTQPYSVERRKNARHLHLIDAMRKLAKKRETNLHKQQHVASLAAMRKANEAVKQRPVMHTPQEFSRLKYERQQQMELKARQYRDQMIQHQKANQAAKANQPPGQLNNGMQPVRNPVPGMPNGGSPNMAAAVPHTQIRGAGGDLPRPGSQMPRIPNGQTNGMLPTNGHGVPHAPMQPNLQVQIQLQQQMQQRIPPNMASDSNRIVQEAARLHAEQQAIRQQRQPLLNGQAGSPPVPNPSLLSQHSPAVLASLQGRSSPSINGIPHTSGSSTSPRAQAQSLSNGITPAINQISSQMRARNPQASEEQISRMTTEHLSRISNEYGRHQASSSDLARQTAMQSAAGTANANAVARNSNMGLQAPSPMQHSPMVPVTSNSSTLSSQQYAQFMRSQQASQQRRGSAGGGQGINGSRSGTPAQGGPRPSQSPSARQVGLAGGQ
ncbi:chromatin modification-related protein VID21, partial [Lecanoromycetidae sp. Uapishka_2]